MIDYESLQEKTVNDFRAVNRDVINIVRNYKRDVTPEKISLLIYYLHYWNSRSSHRFQKERLINMSQRELHDKVKALSPKQIKRAKRFLIENHVINQVKGTYTKDKRKNSYFLNENNEIAKACNSGNIQMFYTFTYEYAEKITSKSDLLNTAMTIHQLIFWSTKAVHKCNNKKWFNKSARELSEELPWIKQRTMQDILISIKKDKIFHTRDGLYPKNVVKMSYSPNLEHPLTRAILLTDKLRTEYNKTLKQNPEYNGFEMFIQTCNNFDYIDELLDVMEQKVWSNFAPHFKNGPKLRNGPKERGQNCVTK